LSNKGRANAQLGRTKDAIELFNLVLSIDPNFVYALNGMGLALHRLGRHDEAIEWYDKALSIKQKQVDNE
jgi:tetratricopeptide (TPR) repeat protein